MALITFSLQPAFLASKADFAYYSWMEDYLGLSQGEGWGTGTYGETTGNNDGHSNDAELLKNVWGLDLESCIP